jgi:hypothetical protein
MNPSKKSGNYWKRYEKMPGKELTVSGIYRIPAIPITRNKPEKT